MWQENGNTVFINSSFCNYTHNKSNVFRLNKQRFEGSLLKKLRKAVDESALKWMLDSARNRTKITYTKIKYNLKDWNFKGKRRGWILTFFTYDQPSIDQQTLFDFVLQVNAKQRA